MNKPIVVVAVIAIVAIYVLVIDGSCEQDTSTASQVGTSAESLTSDQNGSPQLPGTSSSSTSVAPDSRNSRVSNRSFDGETLYNEVLPSVATLAVDRGDGTGMTGTGFLAYENGLIVTAWHVVEGAQSVNAKFADGEVVTCSGLVAKDEEQDIAIIKVGNSSRRLLGTENTRPAIGSKAFIVGAPKGREFSFSDGTVSQNESTLINRNGVPSRRETIQYNCPSSPGNSGGPLFDANGAVRGIVSFGLTEGQNLNFAIPISLASKLERTGDVIPWGAVR